MKISELIGYLEEFKAEHGDIPVVYLSPDLKLLEVSQLLGMSEMNYSDNNWMEYKGECLELS